MSIALIATWDALEGHVDDIAEILRAMTQLTREEPGCIRYDVFHSLSNRQRFVLVEVYADPSALEAHSASEHFKKHVLTDALPLLKNRDRQQFEQLHQSSYS
jgi:quinol monooxygenase YgiN